MKTVEVIAKELAGNPENFKITKTLSRISVDLPDNLPRGLENFFKDGSNEGREIFANLVMRQQFVEGTSLSVVPLGPVPESLLEQRLTGYEKQNLGTIGVFDFGEIHNGEKIFQLYSALLLQ